MNTIIEEMLKNYEAVNLYDRCNAIKEIMQEIVLCGFLQTCRILWRYRSENFLRAGQIFGRSGFFSPQGRQGI